MIIRSPAEGGLAGASTTLATELSTLLGLSGIAAANASVDASDFIEDVNTEPTLWTKGSGTPVNNQTSKGGLWSADVAGGTSIIRPDAWGPVARATNPFAFGWRGKFNASGIAAGCLMRGALIDSVAGSRGFYVGFYGTTFTGDGTKFIAASYDGTTKYYASTIAVDALFHKFRLWTADGLSFYFAVDGEAPILLGGGNLPGSTVYMKPYFDAGTAQLQTFDYFVAVAARE